MPVYVLLPKDRAPGEKRPAVITLHGHRSGGKLSPAGRKDIPAIADAIKALNYNYGVQLVREGFVVFAPDARGFGERRKWPWQKDTEEAFMMSSCEVLNHMAIPLGADCDRNVDIGLDASH
jgi:hypothetical protein